jgi:hypothetical protein
MPETEKGFRNEVAVLQPVGNRMLGCGGLGEEKRREAEDTQLHGRVSIR